MPQGLEIYGPDGSLYFGINNRLARFLGTATTTASLAGSAMAAS